MSTDGAMSTPSSAAKRVMENNASPVEASAPKIDRQASPPNKFRKLDFASEPSASSSSKQPSSHDALRTPTPSSAAKPAASAPGTSLSGVAQPIVSTLRDMIQQVNNVAPMLQGQESKTAQMLLDDIPILQKWKCARKPSNAVRDAMLKLGSRWKVQGKEQGIKRKPAEVAKDLEARMQQNANALLTSSFARPVTQNNSSSVEASAPKIARTASPPNKSSGKLNFASDPSASSSSTQLSSHNPLRTAFLNSAAKPAASASGTSLSGVAQPIASTLLDMMQKLNNLTSRDDSVQKLLQDMRILQQWKSMKKPSNKVRDAMIKLGSRWEVQRYEQGKKRQPAEVAKDLEARMRKNANQQLAAPAAQNQLIQLTSKRRCKITFYILCDGQLEDVFLSGFFLFT